MCIDNNAILLLKTAISDWNWVKRRTQTHYKFFLIIQIFLCIKWQGNRYWDVAGRLLGLYSKIYVKTMSVFNDRKLLFFGTDLGRSCRRDEIDIENKRLFICFHLEVKWGHVLRYPVFTLMLLTGEHLWNCDLAVWPTRKTLNKHVCICVCFSVLFLPHLLSYSFRVLLWTWTWTVFVFVFFLCFTITTVSFWETRKFYS